MKKIKHYLLFSIFVITLIIPVFVKAADLEDNTFKLEVDKLEKKVSQEKEGKNDISYLFAPQARKALEENKKAVDKEYSSLKKNIFNGQKIIKTPYETKSLFSKDTFKVAAATDEVESTPLNWKMVITIIVIVTIGVYLTIKVNRKEEEYE